MWIDYYGATKVREVIIGFLKRDPFRRGGEEIPRLHRSSRTTDYRVSQRGHRLALGDYRLGR